MTNEFSVNINQMLQDLIDALQFTKTTADSIKIAEKLERRLYAAHDALLARFARQRQENNITVVD